jgi:hypothetical protein
MIRLIDSNIKYIFLLCFLIGGFAEGAFLGFEILELVLIQQEEFAAELANREWYFGDHVLVVLDFQRRVVLLQIDIVNLRGVRVNKNCYFFRGKRLKDFFIQKERNVLALGMLHFDDFVQLVKKWCVFSV